MFAALLWFVKSINLATKRFLSLALVVMALLSSLEPAAATAFAGAWSTDFLLRLEVNPAGA